VRMVAGAHPKFPPIFVLTIELPAGLVPALVPVMYQVEDKGGQGVGVGTTVTQGVEEFVTVMAAHW
jgi:hypothetical protein